jgi:hypothetical protein
MADDPDLMQRRQLLMARSAELRLSWSNQVQTLHRPLGVADHVRDGVQWLARNPWWPLGIVAVLVVLRPRRVLGLAGMAWSAFGVYRRVRNTMGLIGGPRR